MLTIHLRINDAAGQPTPVRVRISVADGTQFAPLGRWIEFPAGRNECVGGQLAVVRERWFYIDGACEIALPAGVPIRVQVAKGYEYAPLDEMVTLGAGQMALRFAIARWADSRADGWVSVDTRCHFLTPHDALLEAAAEDVDVVNLLATFQRFPSLDGTAYPTVPNLAAFSGQSPALERDGRAVVVNTFNAHPVLGKVALLHSHRPVFPLAFGGEEETDDWGICDWCDQCHRKGGLVVWVDAFDPAGGVTGGEGLVAAVLGKIDAIERGASPRKLPVMQWLYRLWDAGVLVPLAGASGKDSNTRRVGAVRTYARVRRPNPPTPFPAREGGVESPSPRGGGVGEGLLSDWVAAIKTGHAFVSSGPLIDFHLEGTRFRASSRSPGPHGKLEVVANGAVIASADGVVDGKGYLRAELDTEVPAGWVAARWGGQIGFAHSSPIAIGPVSRNPEAVAALLKLIDQTREWAELHGRYANPKRRDQLLARCEEAITKLHPTA